MHSLRIAGFVLALAVLIAIAYALYLFVPKIPELAVAPRGGAATSTETEMKVADVYGSTDAYHIEAHYPQFGIPAADAAIKAAVDTAIAEFKTYPQNPPDSSTPQNQFTGSFNSAYVDPEYVSVALLFSVDTGGAHPNTTITSVNIDRKTEKDVTLKDALSLIGKTLPQLAQGSLAQLKANIGEDLIFPEGAAPKPGNYSTFLISKDRVTFVFNSYQVAAYAAGPQNVWFARVK